MSMNSQDYPNLEQFLGAYFHQDWAADGATWQDVVTQFVRGEGTARARAVLGEIEQILDGKPSEEAVRARLVDLGCHYHAAGTGDAACRWLARVGAELRRVVAACR